MLRFIKSLSLKKILLFWGISSFLLISLSSLAYYEIGTAQISDTIYSNTEKILLQTSTSLEDALYTAKKSGEQIANSYSLQRLSFNLQKAEKPLTTLQYYSLAQTMTSYFEQNPHIIDSISFYIDDGSIFFFRHRGGAPIQNLSFEYMNFANNFPSNILHWIHPATHNLITFDTVDSQLGLLQLWGDKNTDLHAFLQIQINDQLLLDTVTNARITSNSLVTIARNGNILFEDNSVLMAEKSLTITDDDRIKIKEIIMTSDTTLTPVKVGSNHILYQPSNIEGLGIIAILPTKELFLSSTQFQKTFAFIFVFIFLLWLFIYRLISGLVSRPVLSLKHQLDNMDVDNLNTSVIVEGSKEISSISKTIQNLLLRIQTLIQAVNTEMNLKRKAELSALHAQINPHFLYNTLDAVYQLCDMQQTEKAKEMTKDLANFYRVGVSKGMAAIPLHQEILHIRSYLSILKNRFEDFSYDISIPAEYFNLSIIRITIQPFVENAIYHGIRPSRKTGHLCISAKQVANRFFIYIEDNGIGIPEYKLLELKKALAQPLSEKPHSFVSYGIRNVNDRIRLTYGEDYGILITSEQDYGTRITICIPYLLHEPEGGEQFV